MLYTRKGDDGTTYLYGKQAKTFACDQRISKSSKIAEALGALDEINSYLGLCKVKSEKYELVLADGEKASQIVHDVQKNLFIIQAEIAGAELSIDEAKIKEIEILIDWAEKELPPIKSFFISGGTKLAVYFDIARTISRRAERRVVEVSEENLVKVSDETKAYLNRLSSLLYAMARLSNHKFGIKEDSPDYK